MNFDNNNENLLGTPQPLKHFGSPVQMEPLKMNQENFNNNNITLQNSGIKNLKKDPKSQKPQNYFQDISPCSIFVSDNFLISPVKEYKMGGSGITPLKNESVFYSPSSRLDFRMDTPLEKFEFSSNRKLFGFNNNKEFVKGKKINFNIEEDENNNIINSGSNNKLMPNPSLQSEPNKNFTVVIPGSTHPNKTCCTCTKTNCVKKYCACFANGRFCEGCECKNCLNTKISFTNSTGNTSLLNQNVNYSPKQMNNTNKNESMQPNYSVSQLICNCTKSNCSKKYCECFKQGKECGPLCRCVNCVNKDGLREISQLSQGPFGFKNKLSLSLGFNSCNNKKNNRQINNAFINFDTDALGIEINKKGIIIQKRKVDFEDKNEEIQKTPKMSSKKRLRTKTESTNIKTPNKRKTRQRKININKNSKLNTKKLVL